MIASPAVAVSMFDLRPIMPREGMSNSSRTRSPFDVMFLSVPLRLVASSITVPEQVSGQSTVSSSTGSHFLPSISLTITRGCPTCNSYPSRRMVSISTERCSTPRPNTLKLSAEGPGVTRSARFFSSSRSRRSLMWREVTYLPSLPKKGELLIVKSIDMVGSSMAMGGSGSGFS